MKTVTAITERIPSEALALASCPFCGGNAKLFPVKSALPVQIDPDRYIVGCDSLACCECGPPRATAAEAIAAWNKRTPDVASLVEEVRSMREARQIIHELAADTRDREPDGSTIKRNAQRILELTRPAAEGQTALSALTQEQ